MATADTITEPQLIDNLKNGTITRMQILRTEAGRFAVAVSLAWKPGVFRIVTTRGDVREWASLDRLASHLRAYGAPLVPIELVLVQGDAPPVPA